MKKYILIIFLISFCSNQAINEETTAVNETIVVRAELDEYREGWVEQLLSYPLLTEEEYKKSIKFLDSREPGSTIHIKVKGEDYSCIGKDSGLSINRFANEIHPINLYEDGLEEASYLGYAVKVEYFCTQVTNKSRFDLYGPIFYQENQWWGFIEYDDDYWRNYGKDIEIYAFMTKFAERISLGDSLIVNK